MIFYKYHGAGNDFLLADGRDGAAVPAAADVRRLCDRHLGFGSDGLMVLQRPQDPSHAFRMVFFNPDGSGGMMCGNGGRCIVVFAADRGLIGDRCVFEAPDGLHEARILGREGRDATVCLGMRDVTEFRRLGPGEWFLDTGTRHLVRFGDDIDAPDLPALARPLRYDARFAPVGVNVNFSRLEPDGLRVRTYEKGVEAETLACGTGIVATALAARLEGLVDADCIPVRSGFSRLEVAFTPGDGVFTAIRLTGPVSYVGQLSDAF